jgi:hypothetical protein
LNHTEKKSKSLCRRFNFAKPQQADQKGCRGGFTPPSVVEFIGDTAV